MLIVTDRDGRRVLPDEPFVKAGLRVERATGIGEATAKCSQLRPPFVFMTLTIAGVSSVDLLKQSLDWHPAPVVVVIATHDEINTAAEAMRLGAFDCLFRPFSPGRLSKTIAAALEAAPGPQTHRHPGAAAAGHGVVLPPTAINAPPLEQVIAASDDMRSLVARANTLALSDAPIFITGAVGTGKSLFAEGIHAASPRGLRALATIDCPAVAPTGLPDARARYETAGTLVIDEVCELDPHAQALLLAMLESWSAGNTGPRLIATTRHDPARAIRDGRLRPELYYRLNVATLALPALTGRRDDIALIARTKLGDYARSEGRRITGFSEAALEILISKDWPGNTRELLNLLWLLALTQDGPVITPAALPNDLTAPPVSDATASSAPAPELASLVGRPLAEIERRVIEATIRAEGGSLPRAARVLDVSPSTLYRKREAWFRDDD